MRQINQQLRSTSTQFHSVTKFGETTKATHEHNLLSQVQTLRQSRENVFGDQLAQHFGSLQSMPMIHESTKTSEPMKMPEIGSSRLLAPPQATTFNNSQPKFPFMGSPTYSKRVDSQTSRLPSDSRTPAGSEYETLYRRSLKHIHDLQQELFQTKRSHEVQVASLKEANRMALIEQQALIDQLKSDWHV